MTPVVPTCVAHKKCPERWYVDRLSFLTAEADSKLSDELIHEYKEGFRLFDKKNNGTIVKDDLGQAMRSLGTHLTLLD